MPFDVGKGLVSEVEFSYGGFAGKATYDPFDMALVGDQAVPAGFGSSQAAVHCQG